MGSRRGTERRLSGVNIVRGQPLAFQFGRVLATVGGCFAPSHKRLEFPSNVTLPATADDVEEWVAARGVFVTGERFVTDFGYGFQVFSRILSAAKFPKRLGFPLLIVAARLTVNVHSDD